MAYCCVPKCNSKFLKGCDISFHEIPANDELRNKWLKVISRKNWIPNFTSNYSRICSKHFLDSDFRQTTKLKRLLKTAVPSVFPDYPNYLQPPSKKLRSTAVLKKRNCSKSEQLPEIEMQATEQNCDFSIIEKNTQDEETQVDFISKKRNKKLNSSKVQTKRYLKKLQQLQVKYDQTRTELNEYLDNPLITAFIKVLIAKCDNEPSASFVVDLVQNFGKKHPTYSESTIRQSLLWRASSTKGYEYARRNISLKLPSRTTLLRYMGNVSAINDVGMNPLIAGRIKAEVSSLYTKQEKMCSIIIDEMAIQQRLTYDKKGDKFVGAVDMGNIEVNKPVHRKKSKKSKGSKVNKTPVLANRLLCFVASGLSTSYRIPVAYFFTKQLKGKELYEIVKYVCNEVESLGLSVVRLVTDNLSVNSAMFRQLSGGTMMPVVPHPVDEERDIFLSFDYCHIIKNVRSQLLRHEYGTYIKQLHEEQYKANNTVKPVRFLSKKHVYPSSFEKMNVKRAVQVFSPPVTAALEVYKSEAGKCTPKLFSDAEPAISFMKNML